MANDDSNEIQRAAASVNLDFKNLLSRKGQTCSDTSVYGLLEREFDGERSERRVENKRSRDFGYFLEKLAQKSETLESHDLAKEFLTENFGKHPLLRIKFLNDEESICAYSSQQFEKGAFNIEFFDCRMGVWLLVPQFS